MSSYMTVSIVSYTSCLFVFDQSSNSTLNRDLVIKAEQ